MVYGIDKFEEELVGGEFMCVYWWFIVNFLCVCVVDCGQWGELLLIMDGVECDVVLVLRCNVFVVCFVFGL